MTQYNGDAIISPSSKSNTVRNKILMERKGEKGMKQLDFYIRPEKIETIKNILIDQYHCGGMTVVNCMGCGAQKGFQEEMIGIRTNVNLLPKLKVEVIVKDEDVEGIVAKVCDETITGRYGDGKIVVKAVEDVIRVRTKEHGEQAI